MVPHTTVRGIVAVLSADRQRARMLQGIAAPGAESKGRMLLAALKQAIMCIKADATQGLTPDFYTNLRGHHRTKQETYENGAGDGDGDTHMHPRLT